MTNLLEKLHQCKRGLSTATPDDYNNWYREIEWLSAMNAGFNVSLKHWQTKYNELYPALNLLREAQQIISRTPNPNIVHKNWLEKASNFLK